MSSIGHRLGRARDWVSPRNAYARSEPANPTTTNGDYYGLAALTNSSLSSACGIWSSA